MSAPAARRSVHRTEISAQMGDAVIVDHCARFVRLA
jgi:hypothetical protein